MLASYFECYGENLGTVLKLPVQTLHLDLVRCPTQLEDILATDFTRKTVNLSLGLVDGRNIWKNDFEYSLTLITRAIEAIGVGRIWIAPSCSLIHTPCDLDLETAETTLPPTIKQWMAFAKQKLDEIVTLKKCVSGGHTVGANLEMRKNILANESRRKSPLIHNEKVKQRVKAITVKDTTRKNEYPVRKQMQLESLGLPMFPTTTIGSFPQTSEVRSWRAKFKHGAYPQVEYDSLIGEETAKAIRWQKEIGIDVLVHGEFERNDMVEYFGEQLEGFAFSKNGWVQSYGSRCVKPPIIYGDMSRPNPMTLKWITYAKSLTKKCERNVNRSGYDPPMVFCAE